MPETILVVDDNEAMLHALARVLKHAGYDVLSAASGAACLELAAKQKPDLILLDVQLPDISGFDVLTRIKTDPKLTSIFVVHLSAEHTDAEAKALGMERGADGYISQPIENRELLAWVKAFLRHQRTLNELRASEARYRQLFETNPQPMWIVDKAGKRFLAVNDSAIKHYGYSQEEFEVLSLDLLIEKDEVTDVDMPALGAFDLKQQHRRKDGSLIDVEVSQHRVSWEKAEATAWMIADVTVWKAFELGRTRLLQRYEKEVKALEKISQVRQQARNLKANQPLLTEDPELFNTLQEKYEMLLELALEQKIYKVDYEVSTGLRNIADQLFVLRATPRDVINLHCAALKKLSPNPEQPKAQGYVEIGRLAIVELMGYLVSAYRDFTLGKALNAK
ncbi:MAG: response regulator [Limisphaerales bacterium]